MDGKKQIKRQVRELQLPEECVRCRVAACSDCGYLPKRLAAYRRAYPDEEWGE